MSLSEEGAIFEIMSSFVDRLEFWKETVIKAAKVFGIPDEEVRKVVQRLDELEEELLHYQIFGF